MRKLIILTLILIKVSLLNAQEYEPKTFEIVKYKGAIGKYPITMLLTVYPDNKVSGYYYYNSTGKFIKLESAQKNPEEITLIAKQFEEFNNDNSASSNELFVFSESKPFNKEQLTAQWKYNNKTLQVLLTKDKTIGEWKMLHMQSIGFYENAEFHTQKSEYHIVYPSIGSNPILNKMIMDKWSVRNAKLSFINSSKSKYLHIYENFGENNSDTDSDGCWSSVVITELVYISDSILTYKTSGFSYCNNGYTSEDYSSFKISTGEEFLISNIIKSNSIDSVLTLLKNKYKDILQVHNPNVVSTSDAPYFSNYNNKTAIFLSKGGIYFRARLFKLANYYDLFLSYDEVENYLDESFKNLINSL